MAVSQQQKVDFLLKKLGFTKTKTGLAVDSTLTGTKKAGFAEAIPSPLIIANSSVWNEADSIPATPPGSDTNQVRVYLAASSGHRMTVDSTVANNRAFIAFSTYNDTSSTRLNNWIDTQFGAGYLIKVFKGDPNSGGVQLSAAGSGQNDGWFFDYSAGVLNFNDTNVPSGVTGTNIYIVGYRYIGQTGAPTSGISTFSFLDLTVERNLDVGVQGGISTFRNNIDLNADLDVDGHTNLDNVSIAGVTTIAQNAKAVFGNNGELEIFRSATESAIVETQGNNLSLAGNRVNLLRADRNTVMLQAIANGPVELYHNNALRLTTSSVGVSLPQDLDVDGHTNLDNVSIAGVTTFAGAIDANGDLDVDGHTELDNVNVSGIITSAAARVNGTTVLNGNVDFYGANFGLYWNKGAGRLGFLDNATLSFGHGLDTQIKHDNSNLLITNTTGNIDVTGNVVLNNDLDVDGHTNLDNVSIAGVTTHDASLKLNTSKRLEFGTGSNSYIYYESSGSTFFETTGGYYIHRYKVPGGGHEHMIEARPNNSVLLFFNGSEKFKTTSTGIDVTGDATFSGNVSIGGTLTYEDVKNIDAVGLITARSGIRVTGGVIEAQAGENKIPSLYSAMSDLPSAGTYHGMFAHVHATGRGYFAHAGNWMELVNKEVNGVVGTGTERYNIGPVDLTTLDVSGISTFAGNVDINADIDVDGHTNLDNINIAGVTTTTDNIHIGTRAFTANTTTQLKNINMGGEFWNGTAGDYRALKLIVFDNPPGGTSNSYGLGVSNSTLELQSNGHISMFAGGVSGNTKTRRFHITSGGDYLFDSGTLYVQDKIGHYNETNTNIRFPANDTITAETDGVERFRIASDGKVSIVNDLDVDGHTELDNVNVVGVTTMNSTLNIVSAQPLIYLNNTSYENDYQVQNLAGTFTVRDVDRGNNVFQIGKTGLSTFSGQLDVQGNVTLDRDLDVDGHTNLDNVSIAGVTTAAGTLRVGTGHTFHDNGNAQIAGIATVYNQLNIPRYYGSGVPTGQYLSIGTDEMVMYQRWNGSVSNIEFRNHNAFFGHTSNAHAKTLTIQGGSYTRFKYIQSNGGSGTYVLFDKMSGGTGADGFVQLYGSYNNKVLSTHTNLVKILKDIDVDGHTNLDNVSVAGVTTFSNTVHVGTGTTIESNGQATFTGITTFHGGVRLPNYYPGSIVGKIQIGDSNGYEIFHYNNNNYLTFTRNLLIRGDNIGRQIKLQPKISQNGLIVIPDGAVELYHNGTKRLETSSVGISIPQDLDVDGHTNLDNVSIAGVTTFATNAIFDANARFNSTIGVHDGTTGGSGQYLRATGTGVTWASFPSMRTSQSFTASAGQTTFSFTYNVGFLDVFVNGIKLSSSEFTANNGSSVVLSVGSFVGDIVELVSYFTTSYAAGDAEFTELVQDTSPQLGGDLDLFNKSITGTGNVNITGIITATQFKGDGSGLTGIVASGSGVIVKNSGTTVGTAGTIDFGTNLSVSPISSGIVTITASGGGGSGISTISGVVNIANDLDVDGHTNLDNVSVAGVTTFNANVKFDGANAGRDITFERAQNSLVFADDALAKFGNSEDFKLFHDGSNSYIRETGTGSLILQSNETKIVNSANNETIAKFNENSSVELYFNGVKRLETTAQGIEVTGHSELDNVNIAGVVTATTFKGAIQGTSGTFSSNVDITGDLDVDGHTDLDNVSVAGVSTFTGVINASGGLTGTASIAQNLVVEDESSDTSCNVLFTTAASGNLPAKTGTNLTFNSSTGNLSATKFTGDGSGLTGVTASGSGVVVQHDGSNIGTAGTINFSTNLDVSAISAGIVTITASGGLNHIVEDTSPQLGGYLDSNGHNIQMLDNDRLRIGTSFDLDIYHDGNHSYIDDSGTGNLYIQSNHVNIDSKNGKQFIDCIQDGAVEIYHNNSKKIETTSSGATVTGTLTATAFSGDGSALTGISGGTNVGITTNLSGSFTASAGSPSTINTFGYGGGDIVVEYTVFIKNGSDFQTQKLLAMRDGTTIHSTQFAVMFSSSLLVQLDATISSGNILLRATPETGVSGSTTYKIKREVM